MVTEQESTISEPQIFAKILTNQQQIINNQTILLKAERNRRIWGIVKTILVAIIIIVPLFFLPKIMSLMMGEMMPEINNSIGGGFNLDAILGNSDVIEALLSGQ